MSLNSRIKKSKHSGIYGIIAGERLSGKTTLAGTLPGKTLLLQAELLETASESAEQLAKELGNSLQTIEFSSPGDLLELLKEAEKSDYDNIYVDGLSAISDMINNSREIQAMLKKDNWGAFREIGSQLTEVQLACKTFSMETGKNLFMTLALRPKRDANGNHTDLEPVVKGQVALEAIKKLAPVVLAVRTQTDENGNMYRELLTKSDGVYPARIDTILDHNNPGKFNASDTSNPEQAGLAGLLNFLKGK